MMLYRESTPPVTVWRLAAIGRQHRPTRFGEVVNGFGFLTRKVERRDRRGGAGQTNFVYGASELSRRRELGFAPRRRRARPPLDSPPDPASATRYGF